MSARPALSPRSSHSLLVALFLPLLSFPAFAQLSNKRLSLDNTLSLSHAASLLKSAVNHAALLYFLHLQATYVRHLSDLVLRASLLPSAS